jgi:hypothetical protein
MNNNLREKLKKIICCTGCKGSGRSDSMAGASECPNCGGDGHGLVGYEGVSLDELIDDLASLLYSHLIKKLPKEKTIENTDATWTDMKTLVYNQSISEIKQILRRELLGK